jgi:1,4-dihydroxy-2-naphthoate octaprenyltransferase
MAQAKQQKHAVPKLIALLRCGSCRFAAFYFLSFYVAILSSGHGGWEWLLFSAVIWLLHSLGTELVNRLSDQVEDRVNRPERTAYCDAVGFKRLKTLSVFIWSVVACLDLLWLYFFPNPVLAVLLLMAFMAGINYSYGVRFKRKRYLSLFALTFPFAGPFIVGWMVYHPLILAPENASELMFKAGPFVVIIGLLIGSIASTKDITDAKGDELIGYLGVAVSLIRRHALFSILGLISIPFFAIVIFTAANLLPYRFLSLLFFMPVSLLGSLCIYTAAEEEHLRVVKEAVYQYWFVLLSTSLYLYHPTPETFAVILGTAAYWFIASQYLHWTDGIRLWKVRVIFSLLHRLGRRLTVA